MVLQTRPFTPNPVFHQRFVSASTRQACVNVKPKRTLNVGTKIAQKKWKPTKRRGAITAEKSTPGPLSVTLPSTIGPRKNPKDLRYRWAPEYNFGPKCYSTSNKCERGRKYTTLGQGPAAPYNYSHLTKRGQSTVPAPRWSKSKTIPRKPLKPNKPSPSPAQYDVLKAEQKMKVCCEYTKCCKFGFKRDLGKISQTPAPNVYKIPSGVAASKDGPLRSAPAYTILGRIKPSKMGLSKSPGPGDYNPNFDVGRKKSPSYKMQLLPRQIKRDAPGPGDYCPEKVITHKSVPAPSFSIHHSPYMGYRKAYLAPDCPRNHLKEWCC